MKNILTFLFVLFFTVTSQAPDADISNQDFNMMSFFDEDKDGKVSSSQFISYISTIEELKFEFGEEDWQENALYAFQVVDLDHDSFLNQNEFEIFVEELYGFNDDILEGESGDSFGDDDEDDDDDDYEEDF